MPRTNRRHEYHHGPQLQQDHGHQHGPGVWSDPGHPSTELSVATGAMDTTSETRLWRAMDPYMVLGNGWCLDVSVAPGGSTSYPDQHGLRGSMVLGHQHGPRYLTRPWSATRSSVTLGAPDMNSNPGCHRVMDPDMALCSSPVPDNSLASGNSSDHSDQDVPGGNMALKCLHGNRLQPRPRASMCSFVAT